MSLMMVMTTTGTKEEARAIAKHLVEEKLAACVQILDGLESTYLWKEEKLETSQEFLCLIKTRRELYATVEAAIKKNHSYETPEIIALPITGGSPAYLKWIDACLALPIDSQVD